MRLVLFFSRNVSLRTWDRVGMLDREVALYQRLQQEGMDIAFVTYGTASDIEYSDRLPGIRILCNRWGLPSSVYERLLPYLHGRHLSRCDLIKTNQANGAEIALRAARLWRKPLVARCGYMWSDLAAQGGTGRQAEAVRARSIEAEVFGCAAAVIVTTDSMRQYACEQYGLPREKMHVIPNYVLTDLFVPRSRADAGTQLCFIGRFSIEKNPLALVVACAGTGADLVMVGSGPLRDEIEKTARLHGVRLLLPGNQPHADLPGILNRASLFLLVSPHEGNPKTLLEAMSCGLPVIGADAPGIRDIIRHGETGWLCGTDAASIRKAVLRLLGDPELRARLGRNARNFIKAHYGLDMIVRQESDLYQRILA